MMSGAGEADARASLRERIGREVAEWLAGAGPEWLRAPTAIGVQRIRWIGAMIASGDPVALRAIVASAEAMVERRLPWHLRPVTRADVDETTRVALAALGTDREGAVAGAEGEASLGRPYELLLLREDHPVHGALAPGAPIEAALAWVERCAVEVSGQEVSSAWAQYRRELRWSCAMKGRVLAQRPIPRRYDATSHGLVAVFAPEVGELPLTGLDLGPDTLRRVQSVLGGEGLEPGEELTVGDLPTRARRLLGQPGFGRRSLERLESALRRHMERWREVASGVSVCPERRAVVDVAARGRLEAGLGELAGLFGE